MAVAPALKRQSVKILSQTSWTREHLQNAHAHGNANTDLLPPVHVKPQKNLPRQKCESEIASRRERYTRGFRSTTGQDRTTGDMRTSHDGGIQDGDRRIPAGALVMRPPELPRWIAGDPEEWHAKGHQEVHGYNDGPY